MCENNEVIINASIIFFICNIQINSDHAPLGWTAHGNPKLLVSLKMDFNRVLQHQFYQALSILEIIMNLISEQYIIERVSVTHFPLNLTSVLVHEVYNMMHYIQSPKASHIFTMVKLLVWISFI